MTMEGQDPGFESWLEQQLQGGVGSKVGLHPLPAQAAYHTAFLSGGISMTGSSGILVALGGKAAVGVAAAILAVGGAGAVTASTLTGSSSPDVWGKTVTAAVQTCKQKAAAENQHGIGQCVSQVAKEKGAAERAAHSKGKGPEAEPSPEPSAHPTGKPASIPGGPPSSVPGGPPSMAPGGRPSSVPGGPRSSVPGGPPSGAPIRR